MGEFPSDSGAQYFKIPEGPALSRDTAAREKEERQRAEMAAAVKEKIISDIPRIFDSQDFYSIKGALRDLTGIQPEHVLVTTSQGQEIRAEQAMMAVDLAMATVEAEIQNNPDLKPEEAFEKFNQPFMRLGITSSKISPQSRLGFRDSLVRASASLISAHQSRTQLRKI